MKKPMFMVGVVLAVIGSGITGASQPAAATKYQPNMDTFESPFIITSVQPSTSRITVKYNGEKDNFQPLSLINIEAINVEVGATEDQIDESLSSMGQATSYWNYLIYYEHVYNQHPSMEYGPEEKELQESRYQRVVDLDKEQLHILYYSIRPGVFTSTRYLYGKINYDLCMKSAVYKPGVECRAVEKPEGGVWYWPYYEGEKLPLPRDEWDEWGYSEDEPQPVPEPIPTPAPEIPQVDSVVITDISTGNNSITQPVVAVVTQEPNNVTNFVDNQTATPMGHEYMKVPVKGEDCTESKLSWWWLIILVVSLGIEGILLYWWFRRKQKV